MRPIKFLTLLLALAAISFASDAAYVIHSVKGNIIVNSAGKARRAVKGEKLLPTDEVNIPTGGTLEIHNDVSNAIYSSTSSGKMTVSRLMHESKAKAADNSANINARLNFTGRTKTDKANRVYTERGMVTRAMAMFDSTANLEVNPDALAMLIARAVDCGEASADTTLNFSLIPNPDLSKKQKKGKKGASDDAPKEYGFKIVNQIQSPVYINVIKISGLETRKAEISPLGQPVGSYVLLPGQSLGRTQGNPIPQDEYQLIVAAHYSFDIDRVLSALTRILNDNSALTDSPSELNLPLFIRRL